MPFCRRRAPPRFFVVFIFIIAVFFCRTANGEEVRIEAQKITSPSASSKTIRAEGDAIADDGEASVKAQVLEYADGEARASGDVEFTDKYGARLRGDKVRYSFISAEGEASDLEFFPADSDARISAKQARFAGDKTYRLQDASYTTCPADEEDWRVVVDALEADPAANLAVARAARLQIGGAPVFYLPRMSLLLDHSKKKTGFLAPGFGVRESAGLEIETPFYLYLADHYDATFAPRYISGRGILLQNEFRYLSSGGGGEAHYNFIPQDRLFGDGRAYANIRHESAADNWRWGAELEDVSDDDYFEDLGGGASLVARRNFPRRLWAGYEHGALSARVAAERFQTIRDDSEPPHDILPKVNLHYRASLPRKWRGDFALEYARFAAPDDDAVGGRRYRADATIARNFDLAALGDDEARFRGWRLTPRLGLAAARYNLNNIDAADAINEKSPGFFAPSLELDGAAVFFREGGLYEEDEKTGIRQFRGLLHTVEARLLYAYAPHRKQDDAPLFDTGIAELTAERLFSWNRFSGGDRAGDADFIAGGIVWRIWDEKRERESLTLEFGQRYRFRAARVALDENEDTPDAGFSPLIFALRASPKAGRDIALNWEWEAAGAVETLEGEWREEFSEEAAVNVSYSRLRGDDDESAGIDAFAPLAKRWRGVAAARYSLDARALSSAALGLEYAGGCGCWRASFVAERLQTDDDDARARFFFNIELTGLGGFGEDKIGAIAERIRGGGE